jgi:thiosulfate dehydrogenase
MGKFILGLIFGFLAFPILGAAYLLSGLAPVGVTDRSFPLEQYIAGAALESRLRRAAPARDASSFSAADLMAGAQAYRQGCGCHGLPGETMLGPQPKMYPEPPQLFTPDGLETDDPVGVTYWKIRNGIRMTGMPSFKGVLSDEQMWQIAALVARADRLPPDVISALKQPVLATPPAKEDQHGAPPSRKP